MERMTEAPWAAGRSGQCRFVGSEFLSGKTIAARDGGWRCCAFLGMHLMPSWLKRCTSCYTYFPATKKRGRGWGRRELTMYISHKDRRSQSVVVSPSKKSMRSNDSHHVAKARCAICSDGTNA